MSGPSGSLEATADGSSVEPSAAPTSPLSAEPDHDPEREIDEDIRAIAKACGAWSEADAAMSVAKARSNEACHRAVGEIFARSGPTDEDPEKKQILVERVREHPEVLDSTRYNPIDQDAAELHLTLQFGLKQRRGVKSNWKTAVRAAETEFAKGLIKARTVDAFCEWFGPIGMQGARDAVNSAPGGKDEVDAAAIEQLDGVLFKLPFSFATAEDMPRGDALIAIRFPDDPDPDVPIAKALGIVADKHAISCALAALLRQEKKDGRALAVHAEHEMENLDTDQFPASLRIPIGQRHHFGGRTHFAHEDERNEFNRERKLEQDRVRKIRRGKSSVKGPWELGGKGKGKTRLPASYLSRSTVDHAVVDETADLLEADAVEPTASTQPVAPEDHDDEVDYFAELRK